MKKTVDNYTEGVEDGIDCRVRVFAPDDPQQSMIVLITWIPRPPTELLDPLLSEITASFREGFLHISANHMTRDYSLVEHHALPGGKERIGLILFADLPDLPHHWQPIDRDLLEELIGESLDAPVSQNLIRPTDSKERLLESEPLARLALVT